MTIKLYTLRMHAINSAKWGNATFQILMDEMFEKHGLALSDYVMDFGHLHVTLNGILI